MLELDGGDELSKFLPGTRVRNKYPLYEEGEVVGTRNFTTAFKSCLPSGPTVFVKFKDGEVSCFRPSHLEIIEKK